MTNRLAQESSPYLLQHAENPVDWYPWGPEAIERAQREQKPIFLSVGYSACHWCHVMEHESFENKALAEKLNQAFISIKVDREERPDIDQIYMNAVQMMTGRGGWPMSVFLTPELQPFYGGTYWPPAARQGMPGFGDVLDAVEDAWKHRREQAVEQAAKLTVQLGRVGQRPSSSTELNSERLTATAAQLEQVFDATHGGFGKAPKFPRPVDLKLLLRIWERTQQAGLLEMVTQTLDKMAAGGIYDHLGGGFARYSTDARWLVPHFEKMLYDNALLAGTYLEGYLATGRPEYACVVQETCDYILRDMTDEAGGFHSTEDADSEGVEGKFYVWTRAEIEAALGPQVAEKLCAVYGVSDSGNFEGQNILYLPRAWQETAAQQSWNEDDLEAELTAARKKLLEVREQRVRPGKDDKVLVSWNALMIDSLARAGVVLAVPRYIASASRAAEFLLREVRQENGRLFHSWRHGTARHPGFLDDYSYLMLALQTLYEATFDERWIDEAMRLADTLLEQFYDPQDGGFFYTANDHEQLIARNKDLHDSSVPSGNGMAATALIRLGKLCGRGDLLEAAQRTLEYAQGLIEESPTAVGQLLLALDMQIGPMREIAILAPPDQQAELLGPLRQRFLPRDLLAARPANSENQSAHLDPLFAGKEPDDAAAYVCQDFACQAPSIGVEAIHGLWKEL